MLRLLAHMTVLASLALTALPASAVLSDGATEALVTNDDTCLTGRCHIDKLKTPVSHRSNWSSREYVNWMLDPGRKEAPPQQESGVVRENGEG